MRCNEAFEGVSRGFRVTRGRGFERFMGSGTTESGGRRRVVRIRLRRRLGGRNGRNGGRIAFTGETGCGKRWPEWSLRAGHGGG